MGYYVGDIPAEDLVIEPLRAGELVDLAPFTEVDADLIDPDGLPVITPGFIATLDGEVIVVEWPTTSPFDRAGVYELRLTLRNDTEGVLERLPPVKLVADLEDGWHTLDSARDEWPDAPGYDSWLYELLEIAREQVIAYAPQLGQPAPRPPAAYRRAQLMQARNIWNSSKVDTASGGLGEGSFVIRPFPLDWMIKQILRPKPGVPRVG